MVDRTLADSLAQLLPKADLFGYVTDELGLQRIALVTRPTGSELIQINLDTLREHPSRAVGKYAFGDLESFADYVNRLGSSSTIIWAEFDPQKTVLKYTAVLDDHSPVAPGWRHHTATFEPQRSYEWRTWTESDLVAQTQLEFADFLQDHTNDIVAPDGTALPSSLQMQKMATEFVYHQEHAVSSHVRPSSGGIRLTYIADPDSATNEVMQVFEKFALGIPVFRDGPAWRVDVRLKYRVASAKVLFTYALQRPDLVYQHAAKASLDAARAAFPNHQFLVAA